MRFLNTILLILILLLLGTGGTLLYLGKLPLGANQEVIAAVQAPPAPPADPLFVEFKPFTATLNDADMAQILYLEITVRVNDESDSSYLHAFMPEVRSRVLAELSRYSANEVQSPEGRTKLAENLRRAISQPYPPGVSGPNVTQVLFTAFVVQ